MDRQIAILTDEDNQIALPEQCAGVQVYRKSDAEWAVEKTIAWNIGDTQDMAQIRDRIRRLIDRLGDCSILVCRKINGVAYHIFEKHGFEIFEAEEIADGLFDQILIDLDEAEGAAKTVRDIPKEPYCPNDDGIYYFNLAELQLQFPEISSKKAMQRFMEQTPFYKFELICNHLPPWLEDVIKRKNYEYTAEILDEINKRYIIIRKACYES